MRRRPPARPSGAKGPPRNKLPPGRKAPIVRTFAGAARFAAGTLSPEGIRTWRTPKDYLAKAAETLVQLGEANSESERTRLRRAHGVYLQLSTHGAEAAARAAMERRAEDQARKANRRRDGEAARLVHRLTGTAGARSGQVHPPERLG